MTASLLAPPPNWTSSPPAGVRIGNQEPRLRSVPPSTSTLGPEAIDLAAAAGLILDPWQAAVVCDILATNDDGLWAAFETCTIAQRQQGKGGIIEAVELGGLFLFGERLILHSAHEYKTAQEAFLRIKSLIEGCSDLSRYVRAIREANGEQQVILMDGARLRFVARSKGSGRGFTGQRNILDEAYALTRTQLAALLPTMSAQPNPQLNQFSTVPDVDTMPEPEEAVLPGVRRRAIAAQDSGVPGRLAYHDWSMNEGEDPADVDLWYACNPAMGIRIQEDYVRAEFDALGPAKFSTERLGLWPPEGDAKWQIISQKQWAAAADAESPMQDPVAFAVYLTPDREWGCIAAAGAREDADLVMEIVDHRARADWIPARVVELVRKWQPAVLVIDAAGAGANLIVEVRKALDDAAVLDASVEIEITTMNMPQVSQAYGMVYDALTRPDDADRRGVDGVPWRLWHRDDPRLNAAAAGAVTRSLGREGTTWDSLAAEADLSLLVAATNAVWGFVTRPWDMVPMVAMR